MTITEGLQAVRGQFEKGEISNQLLINLYKEYSSIDNPELFIERAKTLFPKGNCGVASLYLKHLLGEGEIVRGSYAGSPHTFLRIGEQIVDITADQFGGPAVYYDQLIEPWSMT